MKQTDNIIHPFSLKEWARWGKDVVTCYGEPAKIVFTEGLGQRPILAVIWDGDTTDCAWYTIDGKDFSGKQGLFFKE